jgi:tagatose-1,6-bisphosphate aldolase
MKDRTMDNAKEVYDHINMPFIILQAGKETAKSRHTHEKQRDERA